MVYLLQPYSVTKDLYDMKIRKRNIVFVVVSLLFLLLYLWVSEGGEGTIVSALSSLDPVWLLGALAMILLYWLIEGMCMQAVLRRLSPGYPFAHTLYVSMIGQLFNNITPFASGGQPMQAVYLVQNGLSLGVATSALLSKFILYQTTLTVYSTVVLLLRYRYLVTTLSGFGPFILLGYLVSVAVMVGLIFICFFQRFTRWVVRGGISILAKVRIIKRPENALERANDELDSFHESFRMLRGHKGMMAEVFFLSCLQLTVYFLIPYFICLAFGLFSVSPWAAVSAQSIVLMFSSFIPLPGAMGGAELGFYNLFSTFIPEAFLNMAVLIWRLITFYLPIFVGLFLCLFTRKSKSGEITHEFIA